MSVSKHIINDPRELVHESLRGLVKSDAALALEDDSKVVFLKNVPQDRVALISGGGSGHEPAHAGFVGQGLLSAGVCGNVFASPNVGQIRRGVDLVKNNKGTLMVIMRYTGDVLLFGLAKEQANATNTDYPVALTVVGDDCAVPRKQGALVGRRGLAGTVLVYKIASALADTGASLEEVHKLAEFVATRVGTIGAGLDHCHVPGTGINESHLKGDQVEIGMGIHNEAGVTQIKLPKSKELVKTMLKYVTDTKDEERAFVPFEHDGKDEVVLMVNNLGGMSQLELGSIANDAVEALKEDGITVRRILVGSFMTSLNLPGFSLTALLLPRSGDFSAATILKHLDAPASSSGWKAATNLEDVESSQPASKPQASEEIKRSGDPVSADFAAVKKALLAGANRVIEAEPLITKYDTIAGDGDCGLTLKAGAEGVIELVNSGKLNEKDIVSAVLQIAQVVEKRMDGTSGALYSIWLNALAGGLIRSAKEESTSSATSSTWSKSLSYALTTLFDYTAARRPSRTLVDPLQTFTETYSSNGQDFAQAVKAAVQAAEATKDLVAKAGRAAYVGREQLQAAQVPDPGAWGVAELLQGFLSTL